jgi:hypothetical protein
MTVFVFLIPFFMIATKVVLGILWFSVVIFLIAWAGVVVAVDQFTQVSRRLF